MSRPRLIAAVRELMRSRSAVSAADERSPLSPVPAATPRPARPEPPDPQLEQLAAEARYHRERFQLYRARVISGSARATAPGRLRELERIATGAEERLAHARRTQRSGGRSGDV